MVRCWFTVAERRGANGQIRKVASKCLLKCKESRQMDLSGPGIDVKLKERNKQTKLQTV
jgi:hypothetical protein